LPDFSSLQLIAPLLQSLEEAGYTQPTPIQSQSIPHLLAGKDLLGIAQTGTGKTAAFSLPILQYLANKPHKIEPWHARALVLAPTRELASQIYESLQVYGKHLGFFFSCIYGGVGQDKQVRDMKRGVDVLVATPGRLLDLMNQGFVKLGALEIFVLDEADRMLDMGFIVDIKRIIAKLPAERQTLLFSATMPTDISVLAQRLLKSPVRVEVTPAATTVDRIDQKVLFVESSKKTRLLCNLLVQESVDHVLVFCRTKRGADRLVKDLTKEGIGCAAIHGNKSQGAREKSLGNFRSGKVKVLVATDIAARGIDVDGISHVINFDLPNEPESYVHRIGRTARAGKEGTAISFCSASELALLHGIEKAIRKKVPVDVAHEFHTQGFMGDRPVASTIFNGKKKVELPKPEAEEVETLKAVIREVTHVSPKRLAETPRPLAKTLESSASRTALRRPVNLGELRPSRRVKRPAGLAPAHQKSHSR